jgi:hypothetical protein
MRRLKVMEGFSREAGENSLIGMTNGNQITLRATRRSALSVQITTNPIHLLLIAAKMSI